MVGVEVAYRSRETGDAHPKGYATRRARCASSALAPLRSAPIRRASACSLLAGGHLASLLSTQPALHLDPERRSLGPPLRAPRLRDPAYRSSRSSRDTRRARSWARSTISSGGGGVDPALRRQVSNELHVTPDHRGLPLDDGDDGPRPEAHARRFAEACQRANVR